MRGLFLLIAVGGILFLLIRWFLKTPPADVARGLRRWGGLGMIGGAIILFVLGQVALAFPLALAGFASLARGGISLGGKPASGNQSSVRSRFVVMELDHDTGQVDGEVIEGEFHGRWLSALTLEELLALHAEAAADPQSMSLIEAYLDQVHPDWQERTQDAGGGGRRERGQGQNSAMTRGEALEILGLEEGADDKAIKAAYTRLMKRFHPDQGGSTYFATRLNEAKDMLLKSKKT